MKPGVATFFFSELAHKEFDITLPDNGVRFNNEVLR